MNIKVTGRRGEPVTLPESVDPAQFLKGDLLHFDLRDRPLHVMSREWRSDKKSGPYLEIFVSDKPGEYS